MKTWTEEEAALLAQNYNKLTNAQLQSLFPNKSSHAIYKKAYKMGLRKNPDIEFRNRSDAKKGHKSSNWNGGVRNTKSGYRQILMPEHPRADAGGYVMEHILVWEQATGVSVPKNCCIHHLNGDKSDNRIENLCMMEHGAHTIFHHTGVHLRESTKAKISKKANERLRDKRTHPFYKEVDTKAMREMRTQGATVKDVCLAFGITKTTYYSKLKEKNYAE